MKKKVFDDKYYIQNCINKRNLDNININLEGKYRFIKYRNLKEFSYILFEKLNPNHIIQVWGLPKKKYRKTNYVYYIKVGKILIECFVPFFSMNLFNNISIQNYIFGLFFSFSCISYFMFIIDIFEGVKIKCLSVLKENLGEVKLSY